MVPDLLFVSLQTGSAAAAASIATVTGGAPAPAEAASTKMWERIDLPFDDTLYDITFDRYVYFFSLALCVVCPVGDLSHEFIYDSK